ncbi:uncharacterized protein LOC134664411 [Cydia fagiglandana]|uniref:uncharacterized protein LOC134664411 n=1 Tax=Cydia fagiglandana TaxID=1458189 RepID=UPI002FEE5368
MTSLLKISKSIFIFIALTFASKWAYLHYFNKKEKKIAPKEIHEVLMFSHGLGELQRSKYSRCVVTQSMDRLLYFVNSPRYTLDICMYVLTNLDLAQTVLKQHLKGVKVRVIVDADMAYASGSHIRKLEKQGIPVRWMKSTNLMHHKFSLIDASGENQAAVPVVIMGSLNWTNQALSGNWEDVTVTSQREIVDKYRLEFDRLWVLFKPIVDKY